MKLTQRIKHWEKIITKVTNAYNRLEEATDAARKAGCLQVEGKLSNAIWLAFDEMLETFDNDGWIEWWVFENKCGERGLSASPNDKPPTKIKTIKQMATLIAKYEQA